MFVLQELCAVLPLVAAQAAPLCGPGPRHPLQSDHQAGLVRLGEGRVRLSQCDQRCDQVPGRVSGAVHDGHPAALTAHLRDEPGETIVKVISSQELGQVGVPILIVVNMWN